RIVAREQQVQEADLDEAGPELRGLEARHGGGDPCTYDRWGPGRGPCAPRRRAYGVTRGRAKKNGATTRIAPGAGRAKKSSTHPRGMIKLWRTAMMREPLSRRMPMFSGRGA